MNKDIILLMKKDFTVLGAIYKTYALFMLLIAVILLPVNAEFALMFYPIFTVYIVCNTTLTYEERFNCGILPFILPVKYHDFIKAKYVLATGTTLFVTIILFVISVLLSMLGFRGITSFGALISSVFIAFLFPAIMLPLNYRFGVEKTRIVTMLLYCVCFGLAGSGMTYSAVAGDNLSFQNTMVPLLVTLCVSILLYIISQKITIKMMYARRGIK